MPPNSRASKGEERMLELVSRWSETKTENQKDLFADDDDFLS